MVSVGLVQALVTTLCSLLIRPKLFSFVLLAARCHAGPPAFSWHFDLSVSRHLVSLQQCYLGNMLLSLFQNVSVAECQRLGIVITSLNNDSISFGTPPYYLTAMEVNGIPTTSFVGGDRTALSWAVSHAAGDRACSMCL
jgi:hypothetical protein